MTPAEANPAAIPAEVQPDSSDIGEITNQQLQSQLISILSIVTATAAQVQWICQQIELFYQSMPPFMRKGMVPTDGR